MIEWIWKYRGWIISPILAFGLMLSIYGLTERKVKQVQLSNMNPPMIDASYHKIYRLERYGKCYEIFGSRTKFAIEVNCEEWRK